MCVFRKSCKNFIPSPYNDVVCAIYCKRNSEVVEVDYAPDMYVKGTPEVRVFLAKRGEDEEERGQKKAKKSEEEEISEADRVIREMKKMMEEQEGELVTGREDEIKEVKEEESTVAKIMKQKMRNKRELKPKELKEANRVIEEHIEVEEYNKRKKEEEELKKKIREIKNKIIEEENVKKEDIEYEICPYCGKKFRNLKSHLRFCKRAIVDDYKKVDEKKRP